MNLPSLCTAAKLFTHTVSDIFSKLMKDIVVSDVEV